MIGIVCVIGGIKHAREKPQPVYKHTTPLDNNRKTELLALDIPGTKEERIKYYGSLLQVIELEFMPFRIFLNDLKNHSYSEMQSDLIEFQLIKIIRKERPEKELPQDLSERYDTYVETIHQFQIELDENMDWSTLIPILLYIKENQPPTGIISQILQLIQNVVQMKLDARRLESIYISLTSENSLNEQLSPEQLDLLKPSIVTKIQEHFDKLRDRFEN